MGVSAENITPYGTRGDSRDKGRQVEDMFDSIAPAYDLMNSAMTMGLHRLWSRRAIDLVVRDIARRYGSADAPCRILDVATGTGDIALALARRLPGVTIVGIDLSQGMLARARKKAQDAGLDSQITFEAADCLDLPFADASFDAVTVAYGVRNFANLDRGYREMLRVLRPGGLLCVVELSTPTNPIVKPFYKLYTRTLIPLMGRVVSHDSRAYSYLPESIAAVQQGQDMLALMQECGFCDTHHRPLTLGVCSIYTGSRPTDVNS